MMVSFLTVRVFEELGVLHGNSSLLLDSTQKHVG